MPGACRWCGEREPHVALECPEFARFLSLIHLDEPQERTEPDPDENPSEER